MEPRLSINQSYLASSARLACCRRSRSRLCLCRSFCLCSRCRRSCIRPCPCRCSCLCRSACAASCFVAHFERNASLAGWTACAVTANEPLIKPAIAAPAIIAFFVIVTFLFGLLLLLNFQTAQYRWEPGKGLKIRNALFAVRKGFRCIEWAPLSKYPSASDLGSRKSARRCFLRERTRAGRGRRICRRVMQRSSITLG